MTPSCTPAASAPLFSCAWVAEVKAVPGCMPAASTPPMSSSWVDRASAYSADSLHTTGVVMGVKMALGCMSVASVPPLLSSSGVAWALDYMPEASAYYHGRQAVC
jgi:hypothetical protein